MRGRRSALAVAAAAATGALLAAGLGNRAAQAGLLPPLPPVSTPTLSLPIPTPTIPVPTPTLHLPTPPVPTPTLPVLQSPPAVLPAQTPPSLGGLPPTPGGGLPGTPGGPGVTALPGSLTGAPPSSLSPPGTAWVPGGSGVSFGTPSSVLGDLLAFLGTPPNVGVEQPTLEHFGSQVQPSTIDAAATAAAHRLRPTGGGVAIGTLILAFSLLAAFGVSRLGRGSRRWYRRLGIAALPAALALGVAAVAAGPRTVNSNPTAASVTPAPSSAAGTTDASTASSDVPAAGWAALGRIAAYENTIAHDDAALRLLTVQAQGPASAGDAQAPVHSATAGGGDVAAQEHALAVSLEGILQQEYVYYGTVAQTQAQASALVAAANTQPASVRNPVVYDVQVVQAAIAQQMAIVRASQTTVFVPSGGAAAVPFTAPPAGAAVLAAPLSGTVTQGFGPSGLPIEPAVRLGGTVYPHFHTGLDIAAPMDTPVRAAAQGVVALAGAETDGHGHLVGFGNYVVIAHSNGMITLYGHLDRVLVKAGQAVTTADPIGLEGSTGNSTGAHVHFELRIGGTPTDPMPYLSAH